MIKAQKTHPDTVLLSRLLQVIRGGLLIVFNWAIIFQFDQIAGVPGLDVMAVAPPSVYYLIGTIDVLMVILVRRKVRIGWLYGIVMSTLILLITPVTSLFLIFLQPVSTKFLFAIIDVLAGVEIIVLVTPSARQYYRT